MKEVVGEVDRVRAASPTLKIFRLKNYGSPVKATISETLVLSVLGFPNHLSLKVDEVETPLREAWRLPAQELSPQDDPLPTTITKTQDQARSRRHSARIDCMPNSKWVKVQQ